MQFGEWLCEEVLKAVHHKHLTFSIPKILRRYFLYDRQLLRELSQCAWESLRTFLATVFPEQDVMIGAVIAIQTFVDFLNFHPHCHVLCTDGTFYGTGSFKEAPALDTESLEKIFQPKVFGMLLVLKLVVAMPTWLANVLRPWISKSNRAFSASTWPIVTITD